MGKKICRILIILVLALGCGGAVIYALTEVSVTNHLSTGIVDIELEEYRRLNDGREVLWEDISEILPGQQISKIPRITNYGNDCYIRARIDFVDAPINIHNIYGISDKWLHGKDGYYYYQEPLLTGNSVELFQGVYIPENMENETMEVVFKMNIDVEAVQSQNFIPDYSNDHPWGNVEIQACGKEGMYDISTFKQSEENNFWIRYEGQTGTLFKNEDDFFKNFPVMLPGDIYTENMCFENLSNEKIKLYFRTAETLNTSLLDDVILKISKTIDGRTEEVYHGKIRAQDLNKSILLGEFLPGASGQMSFEVSVPETLDNEYTILRDNVIWIFSTEIIDDAGVVINDAVPTGDPAFRIALSVLVMALFLGIMAVIFHQYTKGRLVNDE